MGGQAEPAGQADPLGSARQAQFGAPARREAVGGTAAQVGGVAVAGQVAGPRAGRGGVGALTVVELARYPEPLAPATAARRAGLAAVSPDEIADAALKLAVEHDLVIVEGAGGLLVRFDEAGGTLADVARLLDAPVLVVAAAGLGTLNVTALTTEALRARGVEPLGVVIGSWPDNPDLAARCNLADLPESAGAPLLGAVPAGAGALAPADFGALAPDWLAPELGGGWDAAEFGARHAAPAATPTPYHSDGTEDARSNAVRPYGDANRP
ncbi:dethiobiotin synthase [Streptomyces sp. NPDC006638]|uniref:ATP-dependent dethiobiotin synthetase BioD n=1 Tax=Streptomyces sp. NPDC006638 TaxID=3157183 RepID=UPI0033AE7174